MSENTKYAFPEQNNEESIKLLKAQRYYYQIAKKWQMLRLIVGIILPILFIIAKIKISDEFQAIKNVIQNFLGWLDLSWLVLISLIWIGISFLLRIFEKHYISLGAAIQEKFDTKLFRFQENTICFPNKPSIEKINEGAKKFKGNTEKLKNWYALEDSGNRFLNILLAQRTNIVWDRRLKERYRNILMILIVFIFIIEVIIAWLLNLSFKEAISVLFLSSFPLYFLLGEYTYELHRQIESNNVADKEILDICKNICEFSDVDLKFKCRQIQDYIYEKNRLKSVLIPECLYWLKRNKDNKDLVETNKELIKLYKKNKRKLKN